MIRAIWTLVKIAIVIGLVIWVAERPGEISVDWMDYKFTFHVGFFLLIMLSVVVLGIVIFSVIKTVLDLPKNLTRYRDITHKDKGLRAITLGLTAVAAGDAKNAAYHAHRAQHFLDKDEALPQLLNAQAARLNGDELQAARIYSNLIEHDEAGFIGVRGLMQSALDHGDDDGALELGHRALELYPKQDWILRIVYMLELSARNWDSALKVLYRAEKSGAITANKANSDRVAMLLAEADQAKDNNDEALYFKKLQKAYKTDPLFVPSAVRLAQMYLDRDKRKAAVSALEKIWQATPHPDLAALWGLACPVSKDDDPMVRVRWFEKLVDLKSDSVEGLLALARTLIESGLWSEARTTLERAENIRPNVELYKLWARLEDRATHDNNAVREWLEKAADAPRERVWICSETGRVYKLWAPVSDQGLFNTIIWDFPEGRTVISPSLLAAPRIGTALLEAPAKR